MIKKPTYGGFFYEVFGISLDNSEQRINRLIYKSCKTYFSKPKLQIAMFTDQTKDLMFKGVNPERLTKAFNNIFLLYWECTPFKDEHKVPTMLMSINDDKTANFSYIDGDPDDLESVKGCSCWYTVDHDGYAHVKEFNEVLDLKNAVHVNAIAATIVRDIFGNFDIAEAGQNLHQ